MWDKLRPMQRYEALPEWIRWIICWPISLLISVALWWCFRARFVADSEGSVFFFLEHVILRLAHPVVVQICFLVAIYYTIPRGKLGIALTFIILRTLFLVFFLVLTPLLLLGVVPQIGEVPINWEHWWAPFLGEVLTLAASVVTYSLLRKQHYFSGRVPEAGI